jgi:heme/copper-type cytochrome/quinol oxidase subunit 2
MPIVVDARKKEDYEAWLSETAAKQKSAAAPASPGTTPTASAASVPAPALADAR